MIVDMGRHNAYSSDTTAMPKVVIGMVFIVVLCVAAWCITDNPAFTWDKHVPCDIKGCDAVYAHRVQFKDGVERLCHDCYSFMVLNEEDK